MPPPPLATALVRLLTRISSSSAGGAVPSHDDAAERASAPAPRPRLHGSSSRSVPAREAAATGRAAPRLQRSAMDPRRLTTRSMPAERARPLEDGLTPEDPLSIRATM